MIRLTKAKKLASKKGFTLLEVILSVAIMLILTTMMMNGFAATMSYSYHTSVYASTAASNYSNALNNIGANSAQERGAYKTMGPGYGSITEADCKKIEFSQEVVGIGSKELSIQVYRENGGAQKVSNISSSDFAGYRSEVENYGDAADGTYSNNRTAFYYYPKYIRNGTREDTRGLVWIKNYGSADSPEYWWYDTKNDQKIVKVT